MENTPAPKFSSQAQSAIAARATPRDFFLWLGAVVALYGSIVAFLTLIFEYINYVFPDPLAYYGDPYSGSIRFAMASLIVLLPTALMLFYLIRKTIIDDPSRATIWVRRWALMLTLFVAGAAILIDLITLLNTFLGGEITSRFVLKVAVVLLVAFGIALHFLAEHQGYWIKHPKKANVIALATAALAFITIIAGFFIIGTPSEMRLVRYDQQKVQDLQSLQYEIINYYQMKREIPATLADLNDPLRGYGLPQDPQGNGYRYERTGVLSFSLCATFNLESRELTGRGGYPDRDIAMPSIGGEMNDTWEHSTGETCFTRTLDPERYPPHTKPL